jgi:hypothetical protein
MSHSMTHGRRPRLWMVAAVSLFIAAACVATGPATSDRRQVGSFSSISASAGVEVHVAVGGAPSVTVTAGQNVLPKVITRVEGDRLEIHTSGTTQGRITVDVTTPVLNAIDASSSASIVAAGVNAASFDANVSSQAKVELSGTTDVLTLDGSSQSSAKLGNLKARTVAVNLSSQARAEVRASEAVTGDVSSQAKLTVLGSPAQIDVSTSSQGSVDRR